MLKRLSPLLALTAILFAACMSFPHRSQESKDLPTLQNSDTKPTLSMRTRVRNHARYPGENWVYNEPAVADIAAQSFRKSNLFARVRQDGGPADVNIELIVDMHPSPSSYELGFLAGSILMAIPVWMNHSMTVSAEITQRGREGASYQVREKSTDVYWLPLIIGSPFKNIWSAKRKLVAEAVRTITASMYADGVLKPEEAKSIPGAIAVVNSDVDKPSYQQAADVNKFAIVVGIEKYAKDLPPAQFADRDALAIREHLLALGYPPRNIALLTGLQATRSGIAKHLETWLPRNVNPQSDVLFYFSGHGAPDPTSSQAYLVPFDGDPEYLADSAYPIKQVHSQLSRLKARQVVVVLDTCFSGAGGRSILAKGTRPLVATVDLGSPAEGRIAIITAAEANQISGVSQEQAHGLFTYYFLRGLNGAGKDGDGRITVKSIFDYLTPNVQDEARRNNRSQTPQLMMGSSGELNGWAIR